MSFSDKVFALILSILFVLFMSAYAEDARSETEDYLLLGQWSRHHGDASQYNQTHGLIGFERNNYSVGYYNNSYNDPSWFVGYSKKHTPESLPSVQLKLSYVAVTGYEGMAIVPLMVPGMTIGRGLIQLDISYIPMVAATFGFRVNLSCLK